MKNKKSRIWLMVLLAVAALGVAYFVWYKMNDKPPAVANPAGGATTATPANPAGGRLTRNMTASNRLFNSRYATR